MSGRDGEIIPPTVQSRQRLQMTNVLPPEVGGLLTKWHYHFQRQTVQKQTELFDALEDLSNAQQRAIKAKLSLEVSLVSLEFLEEYKEAERMRIRSELKLKADAILAELINSGVNVHMVIQAAKSKIEPPPPAPPPPERKDRPDPNLASLAATLRGGGKYAQQVEALVKQLIKERGGEDKLTDEDRQRMKSAYKQAANLDEGRS